MNKFVEFFLPEYMSDKYAKSELEPASDKPFIDKAFLTIGYGFSVIAIMACVFGLMIISLYL